MQTEEETAAAEEPILEEGSGREQVRKDIFICFVSPFCLAQKLCMFCSQAPRAFASSSQTAHHFHTYTLTAALFCPNI